jgi:AcrR family transcriptional regulator
VAAVPVRFSAADRREQILDVATRIFARLGFQGAKTREIAQRSGVTEALVFRHFPTKEELYWAVIERKIVAAAAVDRMRETLRSGAPDREVLAAVAAQILERRASDQTLSRLLIYSALENHRLSERFFRTYVAECYQVLAGYIRRRVEEGVFRPVNPVLAARAFLGMVIYHSWIQELYGAKRYQNFSVQEVSEAFADLWLRGMLEGPGIAGKAHKTSKARSNSDHRKTENDRNHTK